ncbi:MAG TPA: hypothetical protein VFX12_07575 [Vicinamibacterales bacterium]|nr:hypothetical protein [Vicinamibacterales bacterium]
MDHSSRNWFIERLARGRVRLARYLERHPRGERRALDEPGDAVVDGFQQTLEALDAATEQLGERDARIAELQHALALERSRRENLLAEVPLPCVITAADGVIVQINGRAATLLNGSTRGLVGRSMLLFLGDRGSWPLLRATLERGDTPPRETLTIKPRERAPREAVALLSPIDGAAPPMWRWFLLEQPLARGVSRTHRGDVRVVN